jgi:polyhydroxyalkanoate synthesis repressor PhaR
LGIQDSGQRDSASKEGGTRETVVIKKYANRRLYNTATSSYVTLDDLAEMVKQGVDFAVYDAKTGDDITRSVLTQIIFDEESKGQNLLPIRFLRQLIRFYGDSMQAFVPSYLEYSIDSLSREQEKFRQQMVTSLGGEPFRAMEEQARRNMAMFQQAMKMFNPFAGGAAAPDESSREKPAETAPVAPAAAPEDIRSLKEQLEQMQRQLDSLVNQRKP